VQGLFIDQSNSLHSVLGALRGGVGNITSALQRPNPATAAAGSKLGRRMLQEEENAAPAIPPVSSKKDHVKLCKMAQPSLYNGSEDVDEALYTFETYFDATKAPKEMWPKMVLCF